MKTLYYVLAIAASLIIVFVSRFTRSHNPMALPHNELFNTIPTSEAVDRLRKSPKDDVVFAVSDGFWDDDSNFDEVYAAYERYYEERLLDLTQLLGKPSFDGHWMQDGYPVFGVGERVAVWGTGDDTLYLRLHHEDQEVGIEVSLLTPKSPNSNHDSKSIYEETRMYAREHLK